LAAGEAKAPRKVMPKAFKAVFYRLLAFFILGALAVGVLVPYDDPNLLGAIANSAPGAAKSPYVIGVSRLGIKVLPYASPFPRVTSRLSLLSEMAVTLSMLLS
jgi:amino acid transporter